MESVWNWIGNRWTNPTFQTYSQGEGLKTRTRVWRTTRRLTAHSSFLLEIEARGTREEGKWVRGKELNGCANKTHVITHPFLIPFLIPFVDCVFMVGCWETLHISFFVSQLQANNRHNPYKWISPRPFSFTIPINYSYPNGNWDWEGR